MPYLNDFGQSCMVVSHLPDGIGLELGGHGRVSLFIAVGREGYASVSDSRCAAVGAYTPVGNGDVPVCAGCVGLLGEGVGHGTSAYHGMRLEREVSPLPLDIGDDDRVVCRTCAGGKRLLGGTGCRKKGEEYQSCELFFHRSVFFIYSAVW